MIEMGDLRNVPLPWERDDWVPREQRFRRDYVGIIEPSISSIRGVEYYTGEFYGD